MTILAPTDKGEFRAMSLDSPVVVMPGDTCRVVGNQLLVIRGGNVIATRNLTGPETSAPLTITEQKTIESAIFFRRDPVAGVVATLTNVIKNTTTGSIRFQFSNGNEQEYPDGAAAISGTDYLDTTSKTAEDVLIRKTMLNSPDETNLTTVVGGKCSIDFNANAPVTLTIE
jgi:hypothetical protein